MRLGGGEVMGGRVLSGMRWPRGEWMDGCTARWRAGGGLRRGREGDA